MWTSLTFHHRSISWPIDRVFRIPLVLSWRPERTALLTAFPRAAMLIFIVGRTPAEAFVLHLTPPTPSKRKPGRITTHPLITTRRFHQRRFGIAPEATRLAGNRFGFHPIGRHGLSLCVGMGCHVASALARCTAPPSALSYPIMSILPSLPPYAVAMGAWESAHTMSQLSKVKHRRNQWQAKAKQRSDHHRSLRQQLARVKAERDQATGPQRNPNSPAPA